MKEIDHIGIAVHSIDKSIRLYTELLNLQHVKTEIVPSQKVKVAFIHAYNCKVELLEPIEADSPIQKFLKKRGEGIHHIALKTNDIEKDMEDLIAKGVQMIDEKPRIGAGGALVAFLHPKSCGGVLYELCQKRETETEM